VPDEIFNNTGLDYATIRSWFQNKATSGYTCVEMSAAHATDLGNKIGLAIRRCYLSDQTLAKLLKGGFKERDLIQLKIPDAGSVMSGDFGEILTYMFHLCDHVGGELAGAKKWRLKEDRLKASPKSDVVHFALPKWPASSIDDEVICSEVKSKATASNTYRPLTTAMEGSKGDRTGRLAKTLVWLREKEILQSETGFTIEQLERFLKSDQHPTFTRRFNVVVVICKDLFEAEIVADPPLTDSVHQTTIIVIPSLHATYTDVFAKVLASSAGNGAIA
jgi:Cap4 SAVED domain